MPTRKDDYAFFLEPVDLEKVPGYMDVIKQPMDFGSMADKVSRSKYRSLDEFAVSLSHSYAPSTSEVFRTTSASSYPTRKHLIPPGLYITMKPNALKHGHLTTFLRRLPMSSSMRQTGTSRLNGMKMSTWTPTRTGRQECSLGPTHLDVDRPP